MTEQQRKVLDELAEQGRRFAMSCRERSQEDGGAVITLDYDAAASLWDQRAAAIEEALRTIDEYRALNQRRHEERGDMP